MYQAIKDRVWSSQKSAKCEGLKVNDSRIIHAAAKNEGKIVVFHDNRFFTSFCCLTSLIFFQGQ